MISKKSLFDEAKKAGLSTFEARFNSEERLSVSTFNGEIENYTVAGNNRMKLRGLSDGKCGTFVSDRVDDGIIASAVAAVKESARYGQPVDDELFISGKEYEYEKVKSYYGELEKVTADRLISLAVGLDKAAASADDRVQNVESQTEYACETVALVNSNGLDLSRRDNCLMVTTSVVAKSGEETVSAFDYEFVTDLNDFDADAFASGAVKKATDQFGGKSVPTGKYDVVFSPDCTAQIMMPVLLGFSAFDAEQHVSLLESVMGTQAFAECISVAESPVGDGIFCAEFDSEGVPTRNKLLIDKGVPTDFVYDLATAKRAGKKSTGNGKIVGGNIRPMLGFAELLPGEKSLDALFEAVGDGLYITEVSGVHAGLNKQSGNYSIQASGYRIEGGKRGAPVSLITVAGNILTDLKNTFAVGNDSKLTYMEFKTPSIAVKGISVSGE